VVKIPYDPASQQVLGDGSKGGLNVGAVLMLPDGFKIAPPDRIPEEMQEKLGGVYFQSYKEGQDNVVIVGPLPGDQYKDTKKSFSPSWPPILAKIKVFTSVNMLCI